MTRISIIAAAAGAMALGLAQAAAAAPQISDAQYIAAARCQALVSSKALGGGDGQAFDQFMRAQSAGRVPAAEDRAQEAHDDAARQAAHAGPYARQALMAERDGACRSLVEQAQVSSVPAARGR